MALMKRLVTNDASIVVDQKTKISMPDNFSGLNFTKCLVYKHLRGSGEVYSKCCVVRTATFTTKLR